MQRLLIYSTILLVLLLIGGVWIVSSLRWTTTVLDRQNVSPGIQYVAVRYEHKNLHAPIEVRAFIITPSQNQLGLVSQANPDPEQALSLASLLEFHNAEIVINGGYFDAGFQPVGLIIEKGEQVQALSTQPALSGVVVFNRVGRLSLDQAAGFSAGREVHDAFQAGPFIIENSERGIHSDDMKRAQRSAVGVTHDGRVVLITTSPCSLYELCEILQSQGSRILGHSVFDRVLNLDGGPSSGIAVAEQPELSHSEDGPVQNVIAVWSNDFNSSATTQTP